MTWPNLVRLTLALLWVGVAAMQQAQAPAQSPPKHLLFGGTVTQLDAEHITISRTLPGKNPEHRTFLINAATKMSRAVKLRSRVTVRYRHLPEGDVALEIGLRPLARIPRVS